LKAMGDMAADVRIDFYVPEFEELEGLVSSYGISNSVRIHSPVTQNEILDLEARADALLLLRWDDPGENSVIAGKFFEYIGAGRPILSVGSTKGEVAEIIHENDFGVVTKDPEEIAATLRTWLAIKKEQGRLPGLDPVRRKQFERSIQFQKIESFLTSIIEP
jgi:glycosyltransferase involved in cell wall biosynthesis